jgi:hypothetical protein
VVEPGPGGFELLHWPPGDDSGPGLRMEIRHGGQTVYPQDGAAPPDWEQFREGAAQATGLPTAMIQRMMDRAMGQVLQQQEPDGTTPLPQPQPETQPESQARTEAVGFVRMAKTGNPCRDPRELDEQFRQWLDGLQPDWGPAQIGRHLESFFALLCGFYETVTEATVLLDAAASGLKERGYRYPKKRLRSLFVEQASTQKQLLKAQTEGQSGGILDAQARYYARSRSPLAAGETTPPCGILDRQADGRQIANFEVVIEEEQQVEDDLAPQTVFVGTFRTSDRGTLPWRISAADYASNAEFQASLYNVGGGGIQFDPHLGALRNAIAEISPADRRRRRVTTSFGWDEGRTAYLVPGGRITANGFELLGPNAELCGPDQLHPAGRLPGADAAGARRAAARQAAPGGGLAGQPRPPCHLQPAGYGRRRRPVPVHDRPAAVRPLAGGADGDGQIVRGSAGAALLRGLPGHRGSHPVLDLHGQPHPDDGLLLPRRPLSGR